MTHAKKSSRKTLTNGAQGSPFSGRVVDEMGCPVEGARIALVNTPLAAMTDSDGAFTIGGDGFDCDSTIPGASMLPLCFEVSAEKHVTKTFVPEEAHLKNLIFQLWSYPPPREGDLVDITPWAYAYRKNSPANPPEMEWLWVSKDIVRDGPIWKLCDGEFVEKSFPREKVLCGLLWEEKRMLNHVKIEFSGPDLPDSEDLAILVANKGSLWTPDFTAQLYRTTKTEDVRQGVLVYGARPFRPTPDFSAQKLYVVNHGRQTNVGVPSIRAYGVSRWQKPLTLEIEWGFQGGESPAQWSGRAEVYNGIIENIAALENGNGLAMLGKQCWREETNARSRRGIRVSLWQTDSPLKENPLESRTIVTLWTEGGNLSFAVRDLEQGPVLIPSAGVFVSKTGTGITARQFQEQIGANGKKTIRERVRERSEISVKSAMRTFHGDQKEFPPFPTPPFEPSMKIHVPEDQINSQWRVGAWHLLRLAEKMDDHTYCPNIFRRTYEVPYCGGGAAIGQESFQIIRALDLMGMHEQAECCLNYWLFGEHAAPFVWYAEQMRDGALVNPYNGPNHISPGYDQKHSGGHGQILHTAAFHYRLTHDKSWYRKARPVLEKACQAILRVRNEWMKKLPGDCWAYGLIPPAVCSDCNDMRLFYFMSTVWYSGLQAAAGILAEEGSEIGADLRRDADLSLQYLRKAVERTAALTPVVRVRDGTYRRYVTWQPYLRSVGMYMPLGGGQGWAECVFGGLTLVPTVYGQSEPIVQDMLDVYEDLILPEIQTTYPQLYPKRAKEIQTEDDLCLRSGQGAHGGYEAQHLIHLLNDDIPLFLRSVFNCYAVVVDPDNGYIFWECPFWVAAMDKPFEESAFLERVRIMLVMEEGNSLWLARATPRAWLAQGKKIAIKNAPTLFGPVDYEIVSDVDNGKITATVKMPARNAAKEVWLRLRHPTSAPIRSVTVNGKAWRDFNPAKEVVRLYDLKDSVTVEVCY